MQRRFFNLKVSTWDTAKTFQIELKLFGEALRANLETKEAFPACTFTTKVRIPIFPLHNTLIEQAYRFLKRLVHMRTDFYAIHLFSSLVAWTLILQENREENSIASTCL
jgi:hypothetical protein